MKTTSELLAARIAAAVSSTPLGRARSKALAAIQWRMESEEGLVAGLDAKGNCLLVVPGSPLVSTFDARDNEATKLSFWSRILGQPLALVLL